MTPIEAIDKELERLHKNLVNTPMFSYKKALEMISKLHESLIFKANWEEPEHFKTYNKVHFKGKHDSSK